MLIAFAILLGLFGCAAPIVMMAVDREYRTVPGGFTAVALVAWYAAFYNVILQNFQQFEKMFVSGNGQPFESWWLIWFASFIWMNLVAGWTMTLTVPPSALRTGTH